MRRDSLCLPCSLKHEELGEDGDGLQEDGERPENFCEGELVVEDEGKDKAGANEVFNAEGINGGVMGGTVGNEEGMNSRYNSQRKAGGLTGTCIS